MDNFEGNLESLSAPKEASTASKKSSKLKSDKVTSLGGSSTKTIEDFYGSRQGQKRNRDGVDALPSSTVVVPKEPKKQKRAFGFFVKEKRSDAEAKLDNPEV